MDSDYIWLILRGGVPIVAAENFDKCMEILDDLTTDMSLDFYSGGYMTKVEDTIREDFILREFFEVKEYLISHDNLLGQLRAIPIVLACAH